LEDLQHRDDQIYRVIFEAEPLSRTQREAAYGGVDRYEQFEGFDNSEYHSIYHEAIDQISRQLYVQSISFDQVFEMAKDKADMLAVFLPLCPSKMEFRGWYRVMGCVFILFIKP
jgi:hypothetical protein